MKWNLVSIDNVAPQSWRNGGGLTRELLAWPSPADWEVRMSVADVQTSGPFSRYDGLERWFAVLEGDGLVLRSDVDEHRLTADSEPFRFDGGIAMDAEPVRGPTRDFNLMAIPGRARMRRVRGTIAFHASAQTLLALYTQGDAAQVHCGDEDVVVPAYHLAWTITTEAVQGNVRAEDGLWMEVWT